ncbi:TetR/AcrR family transcriptional regulator [Iodobacter sp. HSC-16F04]|uniref:TetR/AcrR family transcriptional regulator n=1 Tax=Iodobacter violaceini TaxID=3044271 RepID=A0ABX0KX71_9NEIS|nr:TetR/AcrR family transcriptional regulator [Iodobacter violacea]NHQ88419.1 TetR/AcrR family transcriptional regulator [Iodobacter violacea]
MSIQRKSRSPDLPGDAAKSSVSQNTINHILECAQQVLIEFGNAKFTTRRVAEAAGISPGNLTYHFPSKNELINAMVAKILEKYFLHLEESLSPEGQLYAEGLRGLVRWMMMDAIQNETTRTFRELWAMALHDEQICQTVDAFYDAMIERSAALVSLRYPAANTLAINELIHLLAIVMEGSNVLYGTCNTRAVSFERIIEMTMPIVEQIAPQGV